MQTPAIAMPSQSSQFIQFHDRSGQQRQFRLIGDGAVESEVAASLPQESFLRSLSDPRLGSGEADVAKLGSGWGYRYDSWVPDGSAVRMGSSEGSHQDLTARKLANGNREVVLETVVDGVQHRLSGEFQNGSLNPASVKEQVVLDASSVGLPVYSNGAVLFDLPSAFTGGCSW